MQAGQGHTPLFDGIQRRVAEGAPRAAVPAHGGYFDDPRQRWLMENYAQADFTPTHPSFQSDRGPVAAAQQLAATLWGADDCHFFTGGASSAVRAMVDATATRNGVIVVAGNVHKSVLWELYKLGRQVLLVEPDHHPVFGFPTAITPKALHVALTDQRSTGYNLAAVIASTPSYHGVVADTGGIVAVADEFGLPVAIDGSWAPHFGLSDRVPECPGALGAVLWVASTHKGIPVAGQAAMLFRVEDPRIPIWAFADAVEASDSTSASTVLRTSLDLGRALMAERGEELIGRTLDAIRELNDEILVPAGIPRLDISAMDGAHGAFAWNPLQVVIPVRESTGWSGNEIGNRLYERTGIDPAAREHDLLVFQFGVGAGPERIGSVFAELVREVDRLPPRESLGTVSFRTGPGPARLVDFGGLWTAPKERIALERVAGRRAGGLITPYPPGIARKLPGELITGQDCDEWLAVLAAGGHVHGCDAQNRITVLR